MRHDPDIILIGEIRDEETAEIAVRAAMTGHLVLSTLHTNSAIGTVNRLLDMEIKGYLLATALNAIIAQRLLRRICEGCVQPVELTEDILEYIKHVGGEPAVKAGYKRGAGCARCNFTGYQGRVGVYEFLELDQELNQLLGRGDTAEFTVRAGKKAGFFTLEQAALQSAMKGITTIEEVLRVSADINIDLPDELQTEGGLISLGSS